MWGSAQNMVGSARIWWGMEKYCRNRIKFLRSQNRDCISEIMGVGTAFLRSHDQVCTPEITGMALEIN